MKKENKKYIKYLLGVIILISGFFLINHFNLLKGYGAEDIKIYISNFGFWAPIVYVVILSLLPLLLFPDSVIVIAGGMLFGLWEGTILTVIGSLIGSAIAFYIARLLGQEAVNKFIKNPENAFKTQTEKNGFWLVLMLRLIPLFPFKVVSYSAGLSKAKFKDFAIATTIGSLPGIMVYVNLGDKTTEIGSNSFYIAVGLLIALFIGSFLVKKLFNLKKTI